MVRLSYGVVPAYQLSMPHFWGPLADAPQRDLQSMQTFSTFVREKERAVIGAPAGDEGKRKAELHKKYPTDSETMIEAQIYQEDKRRKQVAVEEQRCLAEAQTEKIRLETETFKRNTDPPVLCSESGDKMDIGVNRKWVSVHYPEAIRKYDAVVQIAMEAEASYHNTMAGEQLEAKRQEWKKKQENREGVFKSMQKFHEREGKHRMARNRQKQQMHQIAYQKVLQKEASQWKNLVHRVAKSEEQARVGEFRFKELGRHIHEGVARSEDQHEMKMQLLARQQEEEEFQIALQTRRQLDAAKQAAKAEKKRKEKEAMIRNQLYETRLENARQTLEQKQRASDVHILQKTKECAKRKKQLERERSNMLKEKAKHNEEKEDAVDQIKVKRVADGLRRIDGGLKAAEEHAERKAFMEEQRRRAVASHLAEEEERREKFLKEEERKEAERQDRAISLSMWTLQPSPKNQGIMPQQQPSPEQQYQFPVEDVISPTVNLDNTMTTVPNSDFPQQRRNTYAMPESIPEVVKIPERPKPTPFLKYEKMEEYLDSAEKALTAREHQRTEASKRRRLQLKELQLSAARHMRKQGEVKEKAYQQIVDEQRIKETNLLETEKKMRRVEQEREARKALTPRPPPLTRITTSRGDEMGELPATSRMEATRKLSIVSDRAALRKQVSDPFAGMVTLEEIDQRQSYIGPCDSSCETSSVNKEPLSMAQKRISTAPAAVSPQHSRQAQSRCSFADTKRYLEKQQNNLEKLYTHRSEERQHMLDTINNKEKELKIRTKRIQRRRQQCANKIENDIDAHIQTSVEQLDKTAKKKDEDLQKAKKHVADVLKRKEEVDESAKEYYMLQNANKLEDAVVRRRNADFLKEERRNQMKQEKEEHDFRRFVVKM